MAHELMDFSQPKSIYDRDIVSSMKMNLAKNPDMPALIFGERSETWAEMWRRTNALANGLYALGLEKGDRVALYLKNSLEFSEVFVATTKAGFVKTPVNYNLKEDELVYQLNDSQSAVVVTDPELYPVAAAAQDRVASLKHIIVTGGVASGAAHDYETFIAGASDADREAAISPNDIHMILYTSGTTGRPKGAVRGYAEDYHTGMTVCVEWNIRSGDVQLAVAPQYHAGPCAWFLATLVSGGTLVIMPGFDPQGVLAHIEKHQCNWLMMVPVMYNFMLSLPDEVLAKYDLSSLRTLISGGAPLHTPTKVKIKQFFKNAELNEFYGSTELGVSTTLRDVDQMRKERSVGKPLQDLELKLVDLHGKGVACGEVGQLYSRGLGGFRGYWNNEKATSDAFLDGEWATVGDLARQDEDGYYYIVDRIKDMIITGGVNVYPAEIEETLCRIEGVADAAVIGVPDGKWGEAVKAVIVPKADSQLSEDALIDFCKEKMAKFKAPKTVDFVEAIPRNPSGKILKNELRKPYWEGKDVRIS